MRILAIETSCDETAASIIEASGGINSPSFRVLAQTVHSQIEAHRPYGGVYPNLAKREHAANIIPVLESVISKVESLDSIVLSDFQKDSILELLSREGELSEQMVSFISNIPKPTVDAICVTSGPGLEPALWVGIRTAQALGVAWNIPVYPVNHMEGHVVSVLIDSVEKKSDEWWAPKLCFPVLALLISGGHTELVTSENFFNYTKIGQTRDDAVGEAFDKVARILGLPYPGGPEISKLAHQFRKEHVQPSFTFPSPMINSGDLDFSFSGLKTAVLYHVKDRELSEKEKAEIACAFEDAVTNVLVAKTRAALLQTNAESLIVAGGVAANNHIKEALNRLCATEFLGTGVFFPEKELATDNSVMIGIAGYFEMQKNPIAPQDIVANGNWSLGA